MGLNKKSFAFNIITIISLVIVISSFLTIFFNSQNKEKNSILNLKIQQLSKFKNYEVYLDEMIKSSSIFYENEKINFFFKFEFNEEKIFSCLEDYKIKDENKFLNLLNKENKNYGCFQEIDTFLYDDFKKKYKEEFKYYIESFYKNEIFNFLENSEGQQLFDKTIEDKKVSFDETSLSISFFLKKDFVKKEKKYVLNFENYNGFYLSFYKFLSDFFSNPNCFVEKDKENCLEGEFKKNFDEEEYKFIVENKKLQKNEIEVIYVKVLKNSNPNKGKKILELGLFKD